MMEVMPVFLRRLDFRSGPPSCANRTFRFFDGLEDDFFITDVGVVENSCRLVNCSGVDGTDGVDNGDFTGLFSVDGGVICRS